MVQKLGRKKRFLAEHRLCCFCGGQNGSTTIDHVPNRACFPRREGPAGYEFPACGRCNDLYRSEEHFFAFFNRMCDRDNANYDRESSERLIRGIRNNLPSLYPDADISANRKKRTLKNFGLEMPIGIAAAEVPMAAFPAEIDPILRAVGAKIALALYYKHKGAIVPPTYLVGAYWSQMSDAKTMAAWRKVAAELTGLEIGSRPNIRFGNRFAYKWAVEEKGHGDIFVALAHFGTGLVICSIVADDKLYDDAEKPSDWLTVENWAAKKFHRQWLKPYED